MCVPTQTYYTNKALHWPLLICFPLGKCLCRCKLKGPSGSFSSPFYPSNYPRNSNCFWEIEVEEGHHIELIFKDFR